MEFPYYKINDRFSETEGAAFFSGELDEKLRSLIKGLYTKLDMKETVDLFRYHKNLFAAGEFWGKLMRAACMIYDCTRDETLRRVLSDSMEDMLSVQAQDGEISCCPRDSQPNGTHGSDLWERKYVLLGMYEYYRVFRDARVLSAMEALADYTCRQVGAPPKTPVTETGWAFCGIESSSILEPIVKLYGLTGKEQYLALARHIVEETGGCKRENLFTAIENGKSPKDIGGNGNPKESIAKAYEMMSCFEGLCEYYRATGNERWLFIAKKFFEKLTEEEITLLGSGGADAPYNLGPGTGEQWNFTAYEQTNPDIDLMMETCVTITWMKLCLQMLRLTGDSRAADCIEVSAHNALFGALRPDGCFFDYFPRFDGTRGGRVNFTYTLGDFPLSCCTANGPAGMGMLHSAAFLRTETGSALSLYFPGDYQNDRFSLRCETAYPADGDIVITVLSAPTEEAPLLFRIPGWCSSPVLKINKEPVAFETERGYAVLTRKWVSGDTVMLTLPRKLSVHKAPHGSNRAGDPFFALTWGPLVLSRDLRFDESYAEPLPFPEQPTLPCTPVSVPGVRCALDAELGGKRVRFIDYASAGATWDSASAYRSWFPIA